MAETVEQTVARHIATYGPDGALAVREGMTLMHDSVLKRLGEPLASIVAAEFLSESADALRGEQVTSLVAVAIPLVKGALDVAHAKWKELG